MCVQFELKITLENDKEFLRGCLPTDIIFANNKYTQIAYFYSNKSHASDCNNNNILLCLC